MLDVLLWRRSSICLRSNNQTAFRSFNACYRNLLYISNWVPFFWTSCPRGTIPESAAIWECRGKILCLTKKVSLAWRRRQLGERGARHFRRTKSLRWNTNFINFPIFGSETLDNKSFSGKWILKVVWQNLLLYFRFLPSRARENSIPIKNVEIPMKIIILLVHKAQSPILPLTGVWPGTRASLSWFHSCFFCVRWAEYKLD